MSETVDREDRLIELGNRRNDYSDAIRVCSYAIPHAREEVAKAARALLAELDHGEGDDNGHAIFRAGQAVHSATLRFDGFCIQRRRARTTVEELEAEMDALRAQEEATA